MDTTFTAGPWSLEERTTTIPVSGPDGLTICNLQFRVRKNNFEQQLANAQLIAEAPALYEALAETIRQIEYLHEKFSYTGSGVAVLARAQIALNKATPAGKGEPDAP